MKIEEVKKALKSIDLDKVLEMNIMELKDYLLEDKGLFKTENDIKLFIIENLGIAFDKTDIEFPIRYYQEDEELDDIQEEEALTDEYINSLKD